MDSSTPQTCTAPTAHPHHHSPPHRRRRRPRSLAAPPITALLALAAAAATAHMTVVAMHWNPGIAGGGGAVLCSNDGGRSTAGRSRWTRDPNMLKERKQLGKWRKDILYGWFTEDEDAHMSIWYDPVLASMVDPGYRAITTPASVLQLWFGHANLTRDSVGGADVGPDDDGDYVPDRWNTTNPEVRLELASTCGPLVRRAVSETEAVRVWDKEPLGALAKLLLLGPIGEAVQFESGSEVADWRAREVLAAKLAFKYLSRAEKLYAPLLRAYVARPLLLSSSKSDQRKGVALLGGQVPPWLAAQVGAAREQARTLAERHLNVENTVLPQEDEMAARRREAAAAAAAEEEAAAAAAAAGGGADDDRIPSWLTEHDDETWEGLHHESALPPAPKLGWRQRMAAARRARAAKAAAEGGAGGADGGVAEGDGGEGEVRESGGRRRRRMPLGPFSKKRASDVDEPPPPPGAPRWE